MKFQARPGRKPKITIKRSKHQVYLESRCSEIEKVYPGCSIEDKCCYITLPYFRVSDSSEEHIAEIFPFKPGKRYKIWIVEER